MSGLDRVNWQQIVDMLPSMVAYWDRDLRCRAANRAYETWFGVSPNALLGKTLPELLGARLYALNEPFVVGALGGAPQVFQRVVPGPDGTQRHSLARYIPDVLDGETAGFVAYVVDVSQLIQVQSDLAKTVETLRAEIALREAAEAKAEKLENTLAQSLQMLDTGFLATDSGGLITQINDVAADLFEYSPMEVLGKPFMEVYKREDRPHQHAVVNPVEQLAAQARSAQDAHYVMALSRTGARLPIELRVSLTSDEEGKPSGMFALVREQAALHATERRLRFMEFRIDAIVDASPNALFIVDPEGEIRFVNRTAERISGYSRGEMLRMKIDLLVPRNRRDMHAGHRERYTSSPAPRAMGGDSDELLLLRKDGGLIAVEIGLSPIASDGSSFTLATVTDITERKRSQDALRRSNESLEQFAYVASHDLQEPLRIVSSFAQLLDKRYGQSLDEKAKSYIARIVEGSKRMQLLVGDLLHYSRVGKVDPAVPVSSQDVMKWVEKVNGPRLKELGGTLTISELPPILATEPLLEDVLQNLLLNSIKFRSTEPLKVTVRASVKEEMVEFEFADNGIGIAPEFHERIFQMFQRLHSRTEYEGSGIGLSVVRRIVEGFGGRVWVASAPGRGATFYFTLPKAR